VIDVLPLSQLLASLCCLGFEAVVILRQSRIQTHMLLVTIAEVKKKE